MDFSQRDSVFPANTTDILFQIPPYFLAYIHILKDFSSSFYENLLMSGV